MKTLKHILGVGVVGLALAPVAMADSVQIQDLGTIGNTGRATQVTLSGGLTFADGSTSKAIWAGTRSILADGQLLHAYTLELTGVNGDGQFEQVSANDAVGQAKADALNSLFAGHSFGEFGNREQAVAFQAMVWEIMYDYDGDASSLNLADGNVRVGMVKTSLFELMRLSATRGGAPGTLDIITGDNTHNDLLRVVPLPSTAGLAGLGLMGLAARRRRN